jgi:hypothetical protein
METKFAEFMSNENERLERDLAQAEEKNAAELAERARQRRAEWHSICNSRAQQLDLRKARKEAALAADQEFMAAWQVRLLPVAYVRTVAQQAAARDIVDCCRLRRMQMGTACEDAALKGMPHLPGRSTAVSPLVIHARNQHTVHRAAEAAGADEGAGARGGRARGGGTRAQ